MEQIYQLKENEYKKLIEYAKMNQELNNKKAEELYKKKGTFAIELNVTVNEYTEVLKLVTNGYISDWAGKFPLKKEDKRKIIEFTKRKSEELMYRHFGKVIYDTNKLREAKKHYDEGRKFLWITTFLGWLVALAIMICNFNCR